MVVVVEGYVAGGADQVLVNLLPYFHEFRIELLVNTSLDMSVLLKRPLPVNVSLRKYSWITPADIGGWAATAKTPMVKLARRILSVLLRYPANTLLLLRFLIEFSRKRPEVVFINNGGYPGGGVCRMAAVAAVANGKIKIIHLVHNLATVPEKLFLPLEWLIDRIIERRGVFVAVSEAVADSLRGLRKLKANVVTIPNGLQIIAPPSPRGGSEILKFLQVGYLGQVKNQKLSIFALGLLARQGINNIRITFAGSEVDKGYLSELTQLAERFEVSNQICFMGFVNDIERLYSQHDAVLLTSVVEGMPMCILEAMRAGRAVIATDVGGVSELLEHGQTGYLLKSPDPEALAEIWKELLNKPDILERMGNKAYQIFMEKFTLDEQAEKYLKLINSQSL